MEEDAVDEIERASPQRNSSRSPRAPTAWATLRSRVGQKRGAEAAAVLAVVMPGQIKHHGPRQADSNYTGQACKLFSDVNADGWEETVDALTTAHEAENKRPPSRMEKLEAYATYLEQHFDNGLLGPGSPANDPAQGDEAGQEALSEARVSKVC